jgi:phosphoribosylanthranilate isomerase
LAAIVGDFTNLERTLQRGGVVNVCGLREPGDAAAAAAAGADLIGFIFAPARRQVVAVVARACITAAREAARGDINAVGVFVDAPPTEIAAVVSEAGLDAVQLHGSEPEEALQDLTVPAIKVFKPRPGEGHDRLIAEIERYAAAAVPPLAFLVDGYSSRGAGGTGARADWTMMAAVAARHSLLLGGGLNPRNVGSAISQVRPLGVDVSSGVEIAGAKNHELIKSFVAAARAAFQAELER